MALNALYLASLEAGERVVHKSAPIQAKSDPIGAVQAHPAKRTNANFTRGNAAFAAKNFPEALECFQAAIAEEPNSLAVIGNLAACLHKLKRYAEALQVIDRGLAVNPSWAKGYFRRAQVFHVQGESESAYEAALMASSLDQSERTYAGMVATFENLVQDVRRYDVRERVERSIVAMEAQKRKQDNRIPVTVLSGFLGSGKTTLLTRLLKNDLGLKFGVLVNDITDVVVDAETIQRQGASPTKMVQMPNGCICCTLKDDFVRELTTLAESSMKMDGIVIESTGISEPMPVAIAFSQSERLNKLCRLDTMVTVVDLTQFETITHSSKRLKDAGMNVGPDDERTLADLLIDQVEFANVILLNKSDAVTEERIEQTKAVVQALNPVAKVLVTSKDNPVPFEIVLNTGLYDLERASAGARWKRELELSNHVPETLEYGFEVFTFRAPPGMGFQAKPTSDILFGDLLKQYNVVRSKGYMFIVEDDRVVIEWASAGPNVRASCVGFWKAALETTGKDDRKCELVFMGIGLKRKELIDALQGCLATATRTLTPYEESLGHNFFNESGFGHLYSLMGPERQLGLKPLQRTAGQNAELARVRARMEALASLDRDLSEDEIKEARELAETFKALQQ